MSELVTLSVTDAVAVLTLERPQAHNAFDIAMVEALEQRLLSLARDSAVRVILAVEGAPVIELGFDATIQRIRGPEGTAVVLEVRRATGAIESLIVQRRRIRA